MDELETELRLKVATHDKDIEYMKKQIDTLSKIADKIESMSQNLIILTTEIKHMNEHLIATDKNVSKTQERIDEIESQPSKKWNLIGTTIISASTSAVIGIIVGIISKFAG